MLVNLTLSSYLDKINVVVPLFCVMFFLHKSTYVFVLGDSSFVHHVIDNHVGTSSLYKTLSHIIMFEVDKEEERERERGST